MSHLNLAFKLGITINAIYVIVEFAAGFALDSLGLISDAGHNLGDTISLILALVAFRLAMHSPTDHFTYGFKKSTILVSLVNAVILLVAVGMIIKECIEKFITPQPIDGTLVAVTAGIGVLINGLTAWLFIKDKEKDLNVKGAYLHMAADAMVSVGVVVSGIIIDYTGWTIIDPIIGLVIAVVIIVSTWNLLHNSVRLTLDGVPEGIDVEEIRKEIEQTEGVDECHHLHIWAISTTENALTAHIIANEGSDAEQVRKRLKEKLNAHGLTHSTLEFEKEHCHEKSCGC